MQLSDWMHVSILWCGNYAGYVFISRSSSRCWYSPLKLYMVWDHRIRGTASLTVTPFTCCVHHHNLLLVLGPRSTWWPPGQGPFPPWPFPGKIPCQMRFKPCKIFQTSAGLASQSCLGRAFPNFVLLTLRELIHYLIFYYYLWMILLSF